MRGAATATKTQKRIMATPIIALLDQASSEITFRSHVIEDDT
jgi:hypothetical protein